MTETKRGAVRSVEWRTRPPLGRRPENGTASSLRSADALLTSPHRLPDSGCSTSCGAARPHCEPRNWLVNRVRHRPRHLGANAGGRARTRAVAGSTNTKFVQGDAQTHRFDPGPSIWSSAGRHLSFADLDAASATPHSADLGGRLCFATWQPLVSNEWLAVPGAALLAHAELPPTTDGPGMFAQSDRDAVTATLRAAGCRKINIEAIEVTFTPSDDRRGRCVPGEKRTRTTAARHDSRRPGA